MANTFNNIFRGRSSQSVPFCLAVVLEGPLSFPLSLLVLQFYKDVLELRELVKLGGCGLHV